MTITIELLNERAMQLLEELERLHIIRVHKTESVKSKQPVSKKSRFAGRISPETATELHRQLEQMRTEWNQ